MEHTTFSFRIGAMTCTANSLLVGIVTSNRKRMLARAVEECLARGFPHLVVLDNGSNDGTREYLDQYPSIHKISLDKNEGSSAGFNEIMRYFVEFTHYRWLLLFDDDAYPSFNYEALVSYLDRLSQTNVPACSLKVIFPDGNLCEMNRPGINVLNKIPLAYIARDFHISDSSKECLVEFASFTGLVLRNETVAKAGLVSKEFFLYSDDTYYTLSISSTIGKIRYCPQFCLVHDCNRSSRRLANHGPLRVERDVMNKIVLIREYSSFKILHIAFYIARVVATNPSLCIRILRASCKGILADKALYRNEPIKPPNSALLPMRRPSAVG